MLLSPLDVFLRRSKKKKKTWQGDGNIWNILGKEGKKYERQHLLNNTYMTDSLLGAFTCILTFTV